MPEVILKAVARCAGHWRGELRSRLGVTGILELTCRPCFGGAVLEMETNLFRPGGEYLVGGCTWLAEGRDGRLRGLQYGTAMGLCTVEARESDAETIVITGDLPGNQLFTGTVALNGEKLVISSVVSARGTVPRDEDRSVGRLRRVDASTRLTAARAGKAQP